MNLYSPIQGGGQGGGNDSYGSGGSGGSGGSSGGESASLQYLFDNIFAEMLFAGSKLGGLMDDAKGMLGKGGNSGGQSGGSNY